MGQIYPTDHRLPTPDVSQNNQFCTVEQIEKIYCYKTILDRGTMAREAEQHQYNSFKNPNKKHISIATYLYGA